MELAPWRESFRRECFRGEFVKEELDAGVKSPNCLLNDDMREWKKSGEVENWIWYSDSSGGDAGCVQE